MTDINVQTEDIQKVMDANPVFALQAKCIALIRLLAEKDARILELEKELSKNGAKPGGKVVATKL